MEYVKLKRAWIFPVLLLATSAALASDSDTKQSSAKSVKPLIDMSKEENHNFLKAIKDYMEAHGNSKKISNMCADTCSITIESGEKGKLPTRLIIHGHKPKDDMALQFKFPILKPRSGTNGKSLSDYFELLKKEKNNGKGSFQFELTKSIKKSIMPLAAIQLKSS